MTKRLQSYQELLVEKAKLESLLRLQKEAIRQDIEEIKEDLQPVRSAISIAGKLVTRDSSNWILNAGAGKVIDLLVKKLILGRAGWIARSIVPFVLKNYSSHVISDNKDTILKKIFSFFSKGNVNGQEKEAYYH